MEIVLEKLIDRMRQKALFRISNSTHLETPSHLPVKSLQHNLCESFATQPYSVLVAGIRTPSRKARAL